VRALTMGARVLRVFCDLLTDFAGREMLGHGGAAYPGTGWHA
jgi:hypothetical protein